jgi:hypothetical protein
VKVGCPEVKGREPSSKVPVGAGLILEGKMDRVAMLFFTTDFRD